MGTYAQKLVRGAGNYNRVTSTVSLPVTATANTDFQFTPPAGAIDVSYTVLTTTAYGAATDAQISIGSTAGGVDYVAATSIKAVGRYALTPVNAAAATHLNVGGNTLNIRVVQSGTASAIGASTLAIGYSVPVS
jgi:hypothetical protein